MVTKAAQEILKAPRIEWIQFKPLLRGLNLPEADLSSSPLND